MSLSDDVALICSIVRRVTDAVFIIFHNQLSKVDNDSDCRCLFIHLCNEGKVAVVSRMESAESDIFQAKEILVARHPTLVLGWGNHINIWIFYISMK